MGRPKRKGAPSEMDEMLEEAFPVEDEEAKKPEPEAKKPEREFPDPEMQQLSESERPEPEPEPEPTPEPVPEPEPAPEPVEWTAERIEALRRESEGRQAEIARLRAKLREQRPAAPPPPAPPVAPPSQAPAPDYGAELIQVRDGRVRLDTDRLGQMIREEALRITTPSPEQLRAERVKRDYESLRSDFVSENPAVNSAAIAHVEQAYEYLTLSAVQKAQEWGVPLGSMSFDERMDFYRQSGLFEAVSKNYPHLSEDLPDLLRYDALESKQGLREVLRRYSGRLVNALGTAQSRPASAPAPAQQRYTPPVSQPADLSRAGTVTPKPAQRDRERLDALERKEDENPVNGLSAREIEELEALREKLGVKADMPWGKLGSPT